MCYKLSSLRPQAVPGNNLFEITERRPNVSSADPVRRQLTPALTALYHTPLKHGGCSFVVESAMEEDAHVLAGAPSNIVAVVNVTGDGVTWDVLQQGKRPTRLPEAAFFSFVPDVPDVNNWRLFVLGSTMDPLDVLAKEGDTQGTSVYVNHRLNIAHVFQNDANNPEQRFFHPVACMIVFSQVWRLTTPPWHRSRRVARRHRLEPADAALHKPGRTHPLHGGAVAVCVAA